MRLPESQSGRMLANACVISTAAPFLHRQTPHPVRSCFYNVAIPARRLASLPKKRFREWPSTGMTPPFVSVAVDAGARRNGLIPLGG